MKSAVCCLLLLVVLLAACAPAGQESINTGNPDQLYVVTTTGMLADAIRSVGGAHVYVSQLMAANTDPHMYVSSGRDQLALQQAKLIVYNGLGLEGRLLGSPTTATPTRPIFRVGESIPAEELITASGTPNPHIWLDARLWQTAIAAIRDQLIQLDSAHAADYQTNAQAYLMQVQQVDQYIRDQVNRLPPEQRVLVTLHNAFAYFGRAYGFEVASVNGISTDVATRDEDVQRINQFILDRHIPAVFSDNVTLPAVMDTLATNLQSQGQTVTVAGALYTDALGRPDSEASTYLGMMRYNVDSIVTGLLGLPAE